MTAARSGALGLMAALVYGFGVLVHGAVHLAGGGETFVWASPAHLIMGVSALLALGVAARAAWSGRSADRRRRLGLARAALARMPAASAICAATGVLSTALLLLVVEGAALDPARCGDAVLSGIVALVVSIVLLVFGAGRVLALAAGLVAARSRAPGARTVSRAPHRPYARLARELVRTGALRAPPALPVV